MNDGKKGASWGDCCCAAPLTGLVSGSGVFRPEFWAKGIWGRRGRATEVFRVENSSKLYPSMKSVARNLNINLGGFVGVAIVPEEIALRKKKKKN